MKFVYILLLLSISIVPLQVMAHGGETVVSDEKSLTLEQIILISLASVIFLLLIMYFIIGIKQPKLIAAMLGAAVLVLVLDFIYQKYYVLV